MTELSLCFAARSLFEKLGLSDSFGMFTLSLHCLSCVALCLFSSVGKCFGKILGPKQGPASVFFIGEEELLCDDL